MNWVFPTFLEFLILLYMPLFIESMFSKRAHIQICLVVSFAIQVFEQIRVRFTLLCFQSWRVCLEVHLVTLGKVMVMFYFIRSIKFDVFWPLNSICESHMLPLPTVLTLEHTWIHVHSTYCCNITFHIKWPVNKYLSWRTTLYVPNIYPNDSYIPLIDKKSHMI